MKPGLLLPSMFILLLPLGKNRLSWFKASIHKTTRKRNLGEGTVGLCSTFGLILLKPCVRDQNVSIVVYKLFRKDKMSKKV